MIHFLLFAGHLADYVAKLALLIRLFWEPSLRAHFVALLAVHVAANMHGAYAVIRSSGVHRLLVAPLVLVFGVVTPLLQVVLLSDAVFCRSNSQGALGGRSLKLPLAPLDVVLEGTVFLLATLHIHFSIVLGHVALLSDELVGGSDLLARGIGDGALQILGDGSAFEALLVLAMTTSLANVTSGFVLWDASVSLKVSRAMFLGYRGKCALLAHVILRGNEVAGRAALLAILGAVLRPCYAVGYLAASYMVHMLVVILVGSPASTFQSAILAWPILFANMPQFVDSPKHAPAAQSVASLVCGLRALELAVAASATTAVVLLESALEARGDEDVLEVIMQLRTLRDRRGVLGWGLCLLLHYLCMLARWCGGQAEATIEGTGAASTVPSSAAARSPASGSEGGESGDAKAFWPAALGVSPMLLGAACQRAVVIPASFPVDPAERIPWPPNLGGALRPPVVPGAVSSSQGPAFDALNQPRLQDFDMIRQIGCGEFGQVCQVRWRATQETFAMKRLSKLEYARRRISEKAKREANVLRAASGHPFVVELFFAIESVSEWAIVMEYCPHGDLQQLLLAEGCPGLELSRILKIAAELTLALEHLHGRGIAFRDLKLENVVLSQDGHVKVTDFGLAKQQEGGPDAIDEAHEHGGVYAAFTKTFCGSYGYTAPEVSERRQVHGYAADMYSFGVLILMLLMGGEVQHITQGPPWESRLPPETPGELRAVLDRLTFDFYWAAHHLLKPARAPHRVEVNLKGDVVLASRRSRGTRRHQRPSRPPVTPRAQEPSAGVQASSASVSASAFDDVGSSPTPASGSTQRPPLQPSTSSSSLPDPASASSSSLPDPGRPSRSAKPPTGVGAAGGSASPGMGVGAAGDIRERVTASSSTSLEGLARGPVDFPPSALMDSGPALRRWNCAVGLIKDLVNEQPERRGTVRTLKRHPFFAEEISDWRVLLPRTWLRENLVSELRSLGGPLPRGLSEMLEAFSVEELVGLIGNSRAQGELLATFRVPGSAERQAPWVQVSGSMTGASSPASPPMRPRPAASSSSPENDDRLSWVSNYP